MASGEQLKALLKSHADGDDDRFFSVAMQVAAHEARRGHGRLAEELRTLIDRAKSKPGAGAPIPIGRPRGELANLLEASHPSARLGQMGLGEELGDQIRRVMREQRHAGRIVERGLAPRRKLLLTGPPGTGKSHIAQAIGRAAIQQGYRVIYREAHTFLEELAEATLADTRKAYLAELTRVPLLIIDDLGMRKLPHTAAEDLRELMMRRYERASTMLTSNRPVDDWGKLLGDTAAVTALLDRLLHHAHILKCGPRSWRTRVQTTLPTQDAVK